MHSASKRGPKKPPNDVHIELKRARGEISCAECRRLKLRCDKKVPCNSCVRRGCSTICPNGILSAGQGTRIILADTEQLHRKIAEMSERIRQLEDALAILQAGVSPEPHSLLRDDLLEIKFGLETRHTANVEQSHDDMSTTISALGTLTIGEYGQTRYIGPSGGSETLILTKSSCSQNAPEDGSSHSQEPDQSFPESGRETDKVASMFPFSARAADYDAFMDNLESFLPPQPRAWALCESYLEHFSWWFRPLKRDELINDVLAPIYKGLSSSDTDGDHKDPERERSRCPHLLSVLFMILAVGALVDLTLPPCSAEAEKYYELARDALSQQSILDSPGIGTVQALALMGSYHSLCSARYSLESAWTLISLACKVGQAVGLHRESSAWNLDEKLVQRRRNLFWELFTFDKNHSVAIGRPPSLTFKYVDCELPNDFEDSTDGHRNTTDDFWRWKLKFCKDVFAAVVDALVAAKPPTYNTILDLDRRIRHAILPPPQNYPKPDDPDYNNPSTSTKSFFMSHYRSISMLYIHRTPFAQSLLDHPDNPLSSPYAPSFIAANRCASLLIKAFLHLFEQCPDLCHRFWGIWSQTFSCAIILVLTVHRSPGVIMATSALVELELLLAVFKKGAEHSKKVRQAYDILFHLKAKAEKSYHQHQNQRAGLGPHLGHEAETDELHLAIFGGQTRLMKTPKQNKSKTDVQSTSERASSSSSPSSQPAASTPDEAAAVTQDAADAIAMGLHPSLMEYFSVFPEALAFNSQPNSHLGMPNMTNSSPVPDPQTQAFPPVFEAASVPPVAAAYSDSFDFPKPSPNNDPFTPMQVQESSLFDTPIDLRGVGFADDIVMNEQWMTLMRETGILDGSGQFVDLQAQPFEPDSEVFGFLPPNTMY